MMAFSGKEKSPTTREISFSAFPAFSDKEKSPTTREVSFSAFPSDIDITLPLASSSPRGTASLNDLQKSEEIKDGEVNTELPTFEFEKTKKGVGITLVAGQTENETKARKLNKTEESRLETLRSHFQKQQTVFEKQHKQFERRFRVRSARVLPNPLFTDRKYKGGTTSVAVRPKSLPVYLTNTNEKPSFKKQHSEQHRCRNNKVCATCSKIQNVVKQYEIEMKTNFDIQNNHHTVCLFSDTQMKNFVNLMENKYCQDLPGVAKMLYSSTIRFDGNHERNNSTSSIPIKSTIQERIKAFCKNQEEFNKKHPVSRSVKSFVDNERIVQAKLANKKL